MKTDRRSFLAMIGLAAPAAALAPEPVKSIVEPTTPLMPLPYKPPSPQTLALAESFMQTKAIAAAEVFGPMRYLGLAALKNEGWPTVFDPEDDT